MNGKHCLDTNIVIALFARNEDILTKLVQVEQVFITSPVLGELYYGALKSSRVYENLKRIDDFAKGCTILDCDAETAKVYGKIKLDLTQKGKMIPDNDIWIAAVARQRDLIIVTKDQHFSVVEDLKVENW